MKKKSQKILSLLLCACVFFQMMGMSVCAQEAGKSDTASKTRGGGIATRAEEAQGNAVYDNAVTEQNSDVPVHETEVSGEDGGLSPAGNSDINDESASIDDSNENNNSSMIDNSGSGLIESTGTSDSGGNEQADDLADDKSSVLSNPADSAENPEEKEKEETEAIEASVEYTAHVQNLGWMDPVKDGAIGGTQKRSLRMEALQISLVSLSDTEDAKVDGAIRYRAHVQDIGWQPWVSDGQTAGTVGKGKRLEAVEIYLEGAVSEQYDVYYRAHVSDYGTLGWAKNGETAGTMQMSRTIESVEILLVEKGSSSAPAQNGLSYYTPTYKGTVTYSVHVKNLGWMDSVSDGGMAGTQKRSLQMEALKINLSNPKDESGTAIEGNIQYRAHVQDYGWRSWVGNGQTAGTTGEKKRLEAVQIQLTGTLAEKYDIYYRVHVSNYGTLGWAKNGETAGTMQMGLAAESIEIQLVEKGSSAAPAQDKLSYYTPTYKGTVTYSAHVKNLGWMDSVADGTVAGTQGKSLQMEALKINLSNLQDETGNAVEGNIQYRAHVQDYGWRPWVGNGQTAGTTGEKKRLEAVQIQLTGTLAEKFDVYYRVHVASFGTLGWAKNGEAAGTVGFSAAVESIEIKLYPKGSGSAPAQGSRAYLDKSMIGTFEYSVSFKGSGWNSTLSNGQSVRKPGSTIDAVRFNLNSGANGSFEGSVTYKAHIQNTGWTGSATGGQALGTSGSGLRVEAVQLNLSGEIAKYCDIYYRTCVETYGWLGWAKNGQSAGTSGLACRMEGIEIKIQPKTSPAPGTNSGYFRDTKDAKTALMELSTAQNTIILSNTKYQLTSSERSNLQNAISRFSWSGATVGFVMQDIKTGQILAYNPSVGLYSASCIKGPYVLSLLESGISPNTTMYNTISWSSNSDYSALRNTYGSTRFKNWLTQAGVNSNQGNSLYTTTTSVDLAKMWLKGYGYLAGNAANSSWARSTFQNTLNSAISAQLKSKCTVYSKAGWIAQGGYYNVYTDAGIVMDGDHPYVMAIMSSLPGPSGSSQMKNLAEVVYNIHKNMI